jgi:hypothetical protein
MAVKTLINPALKAKIDDIGEHTIIPEVTIIPH